MEPPSMTLLLAALLMLIVAMLLKLAERARP